MCVFQYMICVYGGRRLMLSSYNIASPWISDVCGARSVSAYLVHSFSLILTFVPRSLFTKQRDTECIDHKNKFHIDLVGPSTFLCTIDHMTTIANERAEFS